MNDCLLIYSRQLGADDWLPLFGLTGPWGFSENLVKLASGKVSFLEFYVGVTEIEPIIKV
jgi:hypothetical protein